MKVHAKVAHKSHRKGPHDLLEWLDKHRVVVGIIGKKSKRKEGKVDNVGLAIIHEFGSGHIPARPWIRPPLYTHHDELTKELVKIWESCKDGKGDPSKKLNALGSLAASLVKNYVTQGDGIPPPNAPSTIKRKGSSRPLVDTGAMVNAVTWEVREK